MKLIKYWRNLRPNQRVGAVLLALYAVVFPLAQVGRLQIGEIVFYISDAIVCLWLLVQHQDALAFARRVIGWMKRHPLSWFVLGWAVGTLVIGSVLAEQFRPALLSLRILAYFLFAGSVAGVFVDKPHFVRSLLLAISGVFTWLGLLQYFLMPDTRFLRNLGWDDHYYRLLGTFFDPNFAGMALVLACIVVFSLHNKLPRYILSLTLMVLAACVAVTFSRSSYLAFASTVAAILLIPAVLQYWQGKEKVAAGMIIAISFALAIVAAPKPGGEGVKLLRTSSIEARATATQEYVAQLRPWSILWGTGLFVQPQGIREETTPSQGSSWSEISSPQSVFFTSDSASDVPNHSQTPDNIFITLLSGVGIVGTVGAIALMIIFIHDLSRHEMLAAVALGGTLIHSQFNNTLFEPFIFQYLMLFILAPLPVVERVKSGFRKKHQRGVG